MNRIAFTLILATAFIVNSALACSCAPPGPPKESLDQSTAVFSGKVTAVEKEGPFGLIVTFAVDSAWKGVAEKTIKVGTASNDAMCGYSFEKGKSYLVYASVAPGAKKLQTNICSRTRSLDDAKEDLAALGEGKKFDEKKKK